MIFYRFEVHLEIKLPTLEGRREILAIALRKMVQEGLLETNQALSLILTYSELTDGWSGAELSGLVRSAGGFALERFYSQESLSINDIQEDGVDASPKAASVNILEEDFHRGFKEIHNSKYKNTKFYKKISKKILRKSKKILGFLFSREKTKNTHDNKELEKLKQLLIQSS